LATKANCPFGLAATATGSLPTLTVWSRVPVVTLTMATEPPVSSVTKASRSSVTGAAGTTATGVPSRETAFSTEALTVLMRSRVELLAAPSARVPPSTVMASGPAATPEVQ
jgi:hypothetical protein